jgi:hypothetical protein
MLHKIKHRGWNPQLASSQDAPHFLAVMLMLVNL